MRTTWNRSITLLTLLGAGVFTAALADTPADQAAASPPAATAAPAATTSAPAMAASANAAPSSSASTTVSPAGESDAALEKRLTNSGYKSKIRNGQKVWCKQQGELGSRLGGQEVCATPDEWRRVMRENQDVVEHIQRVGSQPSGK